MANLNSSQQDQSNYNKATKRYGSKEHDARRAARSRREIEIGNNIAFYVGLVIFLIIAAVIFFGIKAL